MFTFVGYRGATIQRIRLAATKDGKLISMIHESNAQNCVEETDASGFVESGGVTTRSVYNSPNSKTTHRHERLNLPMPTMMRAPGHAPGSFATESAMDELACLLNIDPIKLREINYADGDPETGLPYTSKSLRECYRQGAEKFGWNKRNSATSSMRDGDWQIGYGMATAAYSTVRIPAAVRLRLQQSGDLIVENATHEIGQGVYTAMTQIAAEAFGLPIEKVKFELGETRMPLSHSPYTGTGGSWTTASVGSAIVEAAPKLREQLFELATKDKDSIFYRKQADELEIKSGKIVAKANPAQFEMMSDLIEKSGKTEIVLEYESFPDMELMKKYSMQSFGAHFCEVRVHELTREVRIKRFLGAFGAGRIINPQLARSQMLGGIVWGISAALHEESPIDARFGKFINSTLADYHVPVALDIQNLEAFFVEEKDPNVNSLGVKGIGELGIVGASAAVANAVFHATGTRVRDLPITPDKLLP